MEAQEVQESKIVDSLEARASKLMGSCHMCGKCCEAIHIPYSPEEIAEGTRRGGDWKFIHENWTPITKEEAFEINPHFAEMEKRGVNYSPMHFYTCGQHDKETHRCKVYEDRPQVCSGYPWYGSMPRDSEPFYSMDCGYKEDTKDTWMYKKELES